MEENSAESTNIKRGVSAIIYDKNGQYYFLILKRSKNWEGWEFCKGSIDENENEIEALHREIKEETGIKNYKVLGRLKRKREFENNGIKHIFDVFLVETNMNTPVNIHQNEEEEHSTYLWVTGDGVREKLQWDNEKEVFDDCLKYLKIKDKKKA